MERASAVLREPRLVAGAVVLGGLLAYYAAVASLPSLPTWADVLLTALVLVPAVFALVLLALPLAGRRGLLPVGLALAVLAYALVRADLDVLGNFTKLAAVTLVAYWFLSYFEALSWVILVAAVIPVVDAISVWRGPTRHIVENRPEVFGALSFAFPVPGEGAFQLGLPDLLFFALFLGAAARWGLRVLPTWVSLVLSFGLTMALAIFVDPLGIGGLPALPLLCLAFVGANLDLLIGRLRGRRSVELPVRRTILAVLYAGGITVLAMIVAAVVSVSVTGTLGIVIAWISAAVIFAGANILMLPRAYPSGARDEVRWLIVSLLFGVLAALFIGWRTFSRPTGRDDSISS